MTGPPQVSRSFSLLTLAMAVPLIALLAFISYQRYVQDDSANDGWKTYRNERFKYEFRYPPDWNVVGGREPQPGDDFLMQYVVISPKEMPNPGTWPALHVMAVVNP